jgi:hypothetical protein
MTEKDKKLEEKVFDQDVSADELNSVSGGASDCGKSAFVNGPCPKGAVYVQRCPDNANIIITEELSDMDKKKIMDELLHLVNGGKWNFDTLTEEEKDEYFKVKDELERDGNYVAWNDFIDRMNEKYGK